MATFIDRTKLRGKMAEKMLSQQDMANKLRISRFSFNNKILGKNEFNEKEIAVLVELFGDEIFLH